MLPWYQVFKWHFPVPLGTTSIVILSTSPPIGNDIDNGVNRTMVACSSPILPPFNNCGLIQPHYALILAMVSHSGSIISHSGSISPPRHFDNPTGLSLKSHNDGLLQPDFASIQQWWLAPAPLCPYSGNGIPFRIHYIPFRIH
ncbi:hypothetical protein IV203_005992 [Nitzschia inconspicua]|uniref:Uncharacterized protein n=1 Tax=Nitzschia inconspicua TaxID=303405 RepID=A0A9K3KPX6_9STRA|nr:hypothetical protein IV203_005992 [Nitzschia inconspicua]